MFLSTNAQAKQSDKCRKAHAAEAGVPGHGTGLSWLVRRRGWSMAMGLMGVWGRLGWFWLFLTWSTTHTQHLCLFEGSRGNAAASAKLWLVQHSRVRSETQDNEQVSRLSKAARLYESIRQTIAPYLLYETSKATVTRQMDSTCRHSKSRNLALFVWCILKEMESH